MPGEEALISSIGGSFERALVVFVLIFMVGLVWYLIRTWEKAQSALADTWKENQKSVNAAWEKSTDRIVSKICEVVTRQDKILCKQDDLHEAYKEHDFQAKKIWDNLEHRPCINGKK